MPTLTDADKVLRNDVGKRMATALEAIAQGGGGSAKIEEMTQAEYDQLTPAQKADGTLRAISDGETKIQDIDNVNITTSDNGKLLGVSVSGSDISVSAVETTAADIPYSQGVSVADKLDSLKIIQTGKTNYSGLKGGGWADRVTVTVTFDTPMPNSSYVAFAMINDAYNDFPFIRIYPFQRLTTGFTATCINQSGSQTAVSGQFDWIVIG